QLLQLRKEIERRAQLMGVLNQQINIVSTHLHNLELVQQGRGAKLPDSEEIAGDAAAAEDMLAQLQADSELADSVGTTASATLSNEEQSLYEELLRESGAVSGDAPTEDESSIEEAGPSTPAASKNDRPQTPQSEPG
ncbi:MAG: hypothetical protein H7144_04770, partial [Burkholderiales bacterium]|nr:hypothetical protein [Phycisphaerae bacterium]